MSKTNALVVLLRGINVGGNKLVPMAELRRLASGLGCTDVATYIQSGNLVLSTDLAPAAIEAALEEALVRRFGFSVGVVARRAKEWRRHAAGSPFPDAEAERPNLLHLCLAKRDVAAGAKVTLGTYARGAERIEVEKRAIWIDYAAGAGRSKLTPTVLDRAAGSPVTARNWRTVCKLAEMVA